MIWRKKKIFIHFNSSTIGIPTEVADLYAWRTPSGTAEIVWVYTNKRYPLIGDSVFDYQGTYIGVITYSAGDTIKYNENNYMLTKSEYWINYRTEIDTTPLIIQWGKSLMTSGNLAHSKAINIVIIYPITYTNMPTSLVTIKCEGEAGQEVHIEDDTTVSHFEVGLYNRNTSNSIDGPIYAYWLSIGY